jgi:hypothetical protein
MTSSSRVIPLLGEKLHSPHAAIDRMNDEPDDDEHRREAEGQGPRKSWTIGVGWFGQGDSSSLHCEMRVLKGLRISHTVV